MQPTVLFSCQVTMKQILIFTLGMVSLVSCKKDNVSRLNDQILGTWEYEKFVGYPFNSSTLPPGNGIIIVIKQGGAFERRNHDTIIFKGFFLLEERKDCYGNENEIFFKTSDTSVVKSEIINISGGNLLLSSPNCYADGGTSVYRRL